MLEKVLKACWPFGCRHTHLSIPFSLQMAQQHETHLDTTEQLPSGCSHYVVCLQCGRRFGYDWNAMKVVKTRLNAAG